MTISYGIFSFWLSIFIVGDYDISLIFT